MTFSGDTGHSILSTAGNGVDIAAVHCARDFSDRSAEAEILTNSAQNGMVEIDSHMRRRLRSAVTPTRGTSPAVPPGPR